VNLRDLRRILTIAAAVMAVMFTTVSVLAAIRRSHPARPPSEPAPLAAGTALPRPRQLPVLHLVDSSGRPFSIRSWLGKWVILAPSMTLCHEVCPMTTGVLDQVAQQLRKAGLSNQVVVATATVDPWRDSPARLRAYQRLTGVRFTQLTGSRSEIRRLWRFLGVAYSRVPQGKPPDIDWMTHKPETFDVQHTDALFLLDPANQERIVDEGMPQVSGGLSPALRGLLSDEGLHNLAHPQFGWTGSDVIDDLYHLMGRNIPTRSAPHTVAPTPGAARAALAHSPATLAEVHAQAGKLLGSTAELAARLKSLRGYPVVVNAWASWCPPCRSEFPLFGAAAAHYGRRVAFLGVDTNDSADSARAFLIHHPVSYPSYQSTPAELGWLAGIEAMPTTIFISPSGRVVEVHSGQYETEATLSDDVLRLLQKH
jgi:cytochrome oxidase Cu insertion factor (SCO1/SenC/PrrC family)/thiol-disulfide isomerase/thioredoxin